MSPELRVLFYAPWVLPVIVGACAGASAKGDAELTAGSVLLVWPRPGLRPILLTASEKAGLLGAA